MKQSQTEWILTRLKHGPVTAIDALDGCGCFRLAPRILELRQAGYQIVTKNKSLPNGKVIAEYTLIEKEIA